MTSRDTLDLYKFNELGWKLMARITIEDCLEKVNSRFDLVLLASDRARRIAFGSTPLVDEESDKPTVIALREIAAGKVDMSYLDASASTDAEADLLSEHTNSPTSLSF